LRWPPVSLSSGRDVGKEMTATNEEYQRHLRDWRNFARLMRWCLAAIVITLILLAYFLL
jgi:hypothetical protein